MKKNRLALCDHNSNRCVYAEGPQVDRFMQAASAIALTLLLAYGTVKVAKALS